MRINFFEEYPEDDLEHAAGISFPATVFIAAESVDEYRHHRDRLTDINPELDPAYWAVLPDSYWVSPFASTSELDDLFADAEALDDPVLLDLELPLLEPRLFLANATQFRHNKRRIREFLRETDADVATAEYPPAPIFQRLYGPLGVAFDSRSYGHTRYLMYYTSLLSPRIQNVVGDAVERTVERDWDVGLGLGTIATGVMEDEPILSAESLRADLRHAERMGVEKVTIFRLGGLDERYLDVLAAFAD
jgi:hypothetical protein